MSIKIFNSKGFGFKLIVTFIMIITFTIVIIYTNTLKIKEPIIISYPSKNIIGLDLDNDGIYDFIMNINPWNILNACGNAFMIYDFNTKTFHYEQYFWNITLKDPNLVIGGYPSIIHGNSPWNNYMALDGPIPLPTKVCELKDFYITISYNLKHSSDLPINFAVESWFTKDKFRSNGVKFDEVEMMIWLYWHNLQPAGHKIDELIIPIEVNNTLINAKFEVWYTIKIWHYFAFKIATPIKAGKIKFNYAPFIKEIIKIIGYNVTHLYLEDIEIGSEYGFSFKAFLKWTIHELTFYYTDEKLIG